MELDLTFIILNCAWSTQDSCPLVRPIQLSGPWWTVLLRKMKSITFCRDLARTENSVYSGLIYIVQNSFLWVSLTYTWNRFCCYSEFYLTIWNFNHVMRWPVPLWLKTMHTCRLRGFPARHQIPNDCIPPNPSAWFGMTACAPSWLLGMNAPWNAPNWPASQIAVTNRVLLSAFSWWRSSYWSARTKDLHDSDCSFVI